MVIPCTISIPGKEETQKELSALWDTGATSTCISQEVADAMGLKPEDVAQAIGMENKTVDVPLYSIQISMGNFVIPYIQVLGLPM